jgi:LysR family hydrogen peroxide-inducible transcriptional activator
MTLRELRYLVAVADAGHFGRAAELCHVTQPTLSMQLKKLEDYLGATLIERSSKSICLTPVGRQVVVRARTILREAEELLKCTRLRSEPLSGPLNIGIIPTLSPYFLPSLIPQLRRAHPQLRLVVHEDLTEHLLGKLKGYQLDALLLALPLTDVAVDSEELFDEPFLFACAPEHPLADAAAVSEEQLRQENLLLLTDGHCLRGQALALCGIDGAEAGGDFRATSLETLCQLVAAGIGSTLLPALAARATVADTRFVVRPIRSRQASRRIGLAWRRGCPRAAELRLLVQTIRHSLPPGTRAVSLPRIRLAARRLLAQGEIAAG